MGIAVVFGLIDRAEEDALDFGQLGHARGELRIFVDEHGQPFTVQVAVDEITFV